MLPKLIITDIDGVWTDGGMYYTDSGDFMKRFTVADGWGVAFCRRSGIPVAIMTGENMSIVKRRADKLNIEKVYLGVTDKLTLATNLCQEMGIELKDVAFIGDDLNDLALLRRVGFSASPADAYPLVRSKVNYVTEKRGGEGAFREFVEKILADNDLLEALYEKYY